MIDLSWLNLASWPLWAQVPAVLAGLWGLWKALTMPYWGPTA